MYQMCAESAFYRSSWSEPLSNHRWAAGYNVLAIPLAAGVFTLAGLVLPPAVGALATGNVHTAHSPVWMLRQGHQLGTSCSAISSMMISLQRSMHSSQM